MTPEHTYLNIGCGFRKLNDHWNVDISPQCNPDEVVDLETTPWPWEDDFFEKIHAEHILEHLGQTPQLFTKIIQEMYRVSKDQAEWYINVPHHRSDTFWDDHTHVRALSARTFKMFDQKLNFENISKKLSISSHGLTYNVDIEVYDENYKLVDYWLQQQAAGMIGPAQLNVNMNTMSNVCETVSIFCRVHKPARFADWNRRQNR